MLGPAIQGVLTYDASTGVLTATLPAAMPVANVLVS
jgi:hypothetical protein